MSRDSKPHTQWSSAAFSLVTEWIYGFLILSEHGSIIKTLPSLWLCELCMNGSNWRWWYQQPTSATRKQNKKKSTRFKALCKSDLRSEVNNRLCREFAFFLKTVMSRLSDVGLKLYFSRSNEEIYGHSCRFTIKCFSIHSPSSPSIVIRVRFCWPFKTENYGCSFGVHWRTLHFERCHNLTRLFCESFCDSFNFSAALKY